MILFRSLAAIAGVLFSLAVQAHEPAVSRYRVHEIQPPASLLSGCEPGYARTASIATINDFGVVNGAVTCYTNVIVDPLSFQYQAGTLVAASWFDAICVADLHSDSGLHIQHQQPRRSIRLRGRFHSRPAAACSRPGGRWPGDANGYFSILPARTSSSRRLWMATRVTRSVGPCVVIRACRRRLTSSASPRAG